MGAPRLLRLLGLGLLLSATDVVHAGERQLSMLACSSHMIIVMKAL